LYKEVLQKSAFGPQGATGAVGGKTLEEKHKAASVTPSLNFIPRVQTNKDDSNKNSQGSVKSAILDPGEQHKQASLLKGSQAATNPNSGMGHSGSL